MNDKSKPQIVSFLPWIGDKIEESIKVGPITFWPYPAEAESRITDAKIKSKLDGLFKSFVDLEDKSVNNIVICSYKDDSFHQFTLEEYYELRDAVNILTFSAITSGTVSAVYGYPRKRKDTFLIPSSNVFELSTFTVNDDFITTSGGEWPIENIKFRKPLSIGGTIWSLDKGLINCFDKCFNNPADEIKRLIQSLEWFRLAHTESNIVSYVSKWISDETFYPSKIVMMSTAFETLFGLSKSDGNKKRKLSESVENCIDNNHPENFIKQARKVGSKEKEHTCPYWWAWDFYKLRNKVVHGDKISLSELKYKDWITYLTVADLVLLKCAKYLLTKYDCCVQDKFKDELEFGKVYKILGWSK